MAAMDIYKEEISDRLRWAKLDEQKLDARLCREIVETVQPRGFRELLDLAAEDTTLLTEGAMASSAYGMLCVVLNYRLCRYAEEQARALSGTPEEQNQRR
jgi:hypothetical protein